MTRRPRLSMAGFHHIANHGVEQKNIFKCCDDKNKFVFRKNMVDIGALCEVFVKNLLKEHFAT